MAICVEIAPAPVGFPSPTVLVPNGQPLETCAGYVVPSASEYKVFPSLLDIFSIPATGQLEELFMAGFSIPVITYLAAWGFGVVINWFDEKSN